MTTGQLADHYCHCFLELFISRISESTTGYTCGNFYFPWQRHFRKTQAMLGVRNCLTFETAAGGIEPPSPRLIIRRSTAHLALAYPGISDGENLSLSHVKWFLMAPRYHRLGIDVNRFFHHWELPLPSLHPPPSSSPPTFSFAST